MDEIDSIEGASMVALYTLAPVVHKSALFIDDDMIRSTPPAAASLNSVKSASTQGFLSKLFPVLGDN